MGHHDVPSPTAGGPPRRVNFHAGMLLSADDFAAEMSYHRGMRYLVNRELHGRGVVSGLAVDTTDDSAGVVVGPGLALDGHGREIVLTEAVQLSLPGPCTDDECEWYVVASWAEEPDELTPDGKHARWVERPRTAVVAEPAADDVVLAALRVAGGTVTGVDVDPRLAIGHQPGP